MLAVTSDFNTLSGTVYTNVLTNTVMATIGDLTNNFSVLKKCNGKLDLN